MTATEKANGEKTADKPEPTKPIERWTLASVFVFGLWQAVFAYWVYNSVERPRANREAETHAAAQEIQKEQRPLIEAQINISDTGLEIGDQPGIVESVFVNIRNESDAPCNVQKITLRVAHCDLRNVTRLAVLPAAKGDAAAEADGGPLRFVGVLDYADSQGWRDLPELTTVRPVTSGPILNGQSRRETFHLVLGGDFRVPLRIQVEVEMTDGTTASQAWVGFSQPEMCYPGPTAPIMGAPAFAEPAEEAPKPPSALKP